MTFEIDAEAELFLEPHLAGHAPGVALYSEDRGLVLPACGTGPTPVTVLVVDPIDGTRPALAGARILLRLRGRGPVQGRGDDGGRGGRVRGGDSVGRGVPRGARRGADRGRARAAVGGARPEPHVLGLRRGRPAQSTVEVLAELIDLSSVTGATFDLGSAAFDMTRIMTGQLDAYVEPGPRLIADVPGMLEEFRRVGGGAVLNNAPYDLAAAALCLLEGGAVVTDAAGRSLDDRPLLGSDHAHQMSVVASANEGLHERILAALDAGVERLRRHRAGADPV